MNYNENNPMSYSAREEAVTYDAGLRSYMLRVYNYMASALVLTGITAYLGANWSPLTDLLYHVQTNGHVGLTGLGMLLFIAPLAFVLALSFGINRMSVTTAQTVFWVYAGVVGLSLSSIFFIYTGQSIVRVFFITAIMFGSMSIWGYTTKSNLTGMGSFLFMGLIGVILASVVNIWLHSAALQFAVSIIGVLIFVGLTAYDTQKIKAFYYQASGDAVMAGKSAIMGALALYLDFLNIFLYMLQFFGDRRS